MPGAVRIFDMLVASAQFMKIAEEKSIALTIVMISRGRDMGCSKEYIRWWLGSAGTGGLDWFQARKRGLEN
jgi:hypothetical protein